MFMRNSNLRLTQITVFYLTTVSYFTRAILFVKPMNSQMFKRKLSLFKEKKSPTFVLASHIITNHIFVLHPLGCPYIIHYGSPSLEYSKLLKLHHLFIIPYIRWTGISHVAEANPSHPVSFLFPIPLTQFSKLPPLGSPSFQFLKFGYLWTILDTLLEIPYFIIIRIYAHTLSSGHWHLSKIPSHCEL